MPYETPPRTQLVAHRGNSGPIPENTPAAIESAIDLGVDMVEIDIRLTKDGVPILMHNDRVDATTSGTGLVTDFTWDEFKTLDAGSWRGPEFADEPVRALDEVLDATRGRVALNLDIKVPEAAEPTAVAAIEAGVSASVVISGCTAKSVRTVGEMTSDISTLFNLDELLAGIEPTEARTVARRSIDLAVELGAVAINVPHPLVDTDLVEQARSAEIGVWTFTIDDETLFVDLMDTGVASLTTNWPERMLPLARSGISRPRSGHS
ncbi:MAG: glycerophosphodiester phosphodiesterase [Acidimicrobiia bacterium]|nr:MAG: glycerophosphodiester phosphodiesterase [Acidimicrobiia bacterium]